MRTTIRLDDELLKEAKSLAAANGVTLAEVIENALRESLARRQKTPDGGRIVLPSFKGTGVLPGLNLDDWANVMDLMDQDRERR